MTDHQRAYDAIEQFVSTHRPADANGRWRSRVPETDWHATWPAWSADATAIVNIFNGLISPRVIHVPETAKRSLIGKRLIEFRRYLALKAQELATAATIKRLESSLSEAGS